MPKAGRDPFLRFHECLYAGKHEEALRLFDRLYVDEAEAQRMMDAVLLACANQHDPQLTVPHALQTADAARQILATVGWEAARPVVRFTTLYSFSLYKWNLSVSDLKRMAEGLKVGEAADVHTAVADAVYGGRGEEAAAILSHVAHREGLDVAAHLAVQLAVPDVGRLGHNLALAAAHAEAARHLGMPAGLVPLANLVFHLSDAMKGVAPVPYEAVPPSGGVAASREALEDALFEADYDRVHAVLNAFVEAGDVAEAFRPLLVGASMDPGFLGHTLVLAHSARLAAKYLTPEQRHFLLWKFYRTLAGTFDYPDAMVLTGRAQVADAEGARKALQESLRYRSLPLSFGLRNALEIGVPLAEILQQVARNWEYWTVGEKEHTIVYLNATIQTAAFFGRERALLPLVSAMKRLPF